MTIREGGFLHRMEARWHIVQRLWDTSKPYEWQKTTRLQNFRGHLANPGIRLGLRHPLVKPDPKIAPGRGGPVPL